MLNLVVYMHLANPSLKPYVSYPFNPKSFQRKVFILESNDCIYKDDFTEYDECGTVESILRFVLLLSLLLSLVYGVKQTGVTYHQHTAVVTAAPGPPGHQQSPVYWTPAPGSHNSGLETKVNNFIAESSVSQ